MEVDATDKASTDRGAGEVVTTEEDASEADGAEDQKDGAEGVSPFPHLKPYFSIRLSNIFYLEF